MYRPTTAALAAALAIVTLSPAQAAIIYSTIGSTYSQNFNSLPITPQNTNRGDSPAGWTDDNPSPGANNFSIVGFYLFHPTGLTEGGFSGNQRLRAGTGSSNTGAFYSYGDSGMTERALGGLNSGSLSNTNANMFLGARFTNSTGAVMTSFTLSYDGEQWRDGGAATPSAQRLDFDYSLNATTIQDNLATFVNVDALDFVSPVFANTGGGNAVAGNTTGMVPIGPVTVTGINWAPGSDLWIRWRDVNNSGNDHGLAIDNLQFSAIPEPGSVVLFVSAVLALLGYRRFR
ncbi:MAG: hypothetical protein WD851_22390 [Pirellulales bacterium]